MMLILEITSLCLIAALCYLCTRSDLKAGMIYNKDLVFFLAMAGVIDVAYYGFLARDLIYTFLINLAIVGIASLFLFYTHSFAGGDCKMAIVISLLFPARFCWDVGTTNATLVVAIAFAILAGYCYLLGYSIWAIATKKVEMSLNYIKEQLTSFIKSYVTAIVYISILNSLFMLLFDFGIEINIWIVRILCLIVAWLVGRYQVFKRWFVFLPAFCIVVVISVATRTLPISLNIENYILVLVLLVCQMTIKTTIYETVEVEQLKKGMILTTFSSMLMQTSITKGLPGVSTEDLKSRLSIDEIESIKIWAKATHTEKLTIVKKIPFAIFISIGMCLYGAIWGLLLWV